MSYMNLNDMYLIECNVVHKACSNHVLNPVCSVMNLLFPCSGRGMDLCDVSRLLSCKLLHLYSSLLQLAFSLKLGEPSITTQASMQNFAEYGILENKATHSRCF